MNAIPVTRTSTLASLMPSQGNVALLGTSQGTRGAASRADVTMAQPAHLRTLGQLAASNLSPATTLAPNATARSVSEKSGATKESPILVLGGQEIHSQEDFLSYFYNVPTEEAVVHIAQAVLGDLPDAKKDRLVALAQTFEDTYSVDAIKVLPYLLHELAQEKRVIDRNNLGPWLFLASAALNDMHDTGMMDEYMLDLPKTCAANPRVQGSCESGYTVRLVENMLKTVNRIEMGPAGRGGRVRFSFFFNRSSPENNERRRGTLSRTRPELEYTLVGSMWAEGKAKIRFRDGWSVEIKELNSRQFNSAMRGYSKPGGALGIDAVEEYLDDVPENLRSAGSDAYPEEPYGQAKLLPLAIRLEGVSGRVSIDDLNLDDYGLPDFLNKLATGLTPSLSINPGSILTVPGFDTSTVVGPTDIPFLYKVGLGLFVVPATLKGAF